LTPKVLAIGYAYLSSMQLADIAQPHLEKLVARVRESSSMAILDGAEIVYVARVPTARIMSISLTVGTRLPAYATSMGRVLLSELPDADLARLLAALDFEPLTGRTVGSAAELRSVLKAVRDQGYALNDQELEEGLRSIAVPVRDGRGTALAAVNVAVPASRISVETLTGEILPLLHATAREVGEDAARHRATGGRLSGIGHLD
jgi:IclR family pca regulon transcriptional regulator